MHTSRPLRSRTKKRRRIRRSNPPQRLETTRKSVMHQRRIARFFRAMRHHAKRCKSKGGLYRSRTDTPLRAEDFESSASANSAKRPRRAGKCIIGQFRCNRATRRLTPDRAVALLAFTYAVVPATFASTSAGPYGPQQVVRAIVGTLPRWNFLPRPCECIAGFFRLMG